MEAHALSSPASEVCGFLYENRYVPLTNLSSDPHRFEAAPAEIALALARFGEPIAIFHTHPTGSSVPSPLDRERFYYPHSRILIGVLHGGVLLIR